MKCAVLTSQAKALTIDGDHAYRTREVKIANFQGISRNTDIQDQKPCLVGGQVEILTLPGHIEYLRFRNIDRQVPCDQLGCRGITHIDDLEAPGTACHIGHTTVHDDPDTLAGQAQKGKLCW